MRVKHINEPKEPTDVYIGRGSIWGNPYKIGVHGDRDRVIRLYRNYLYDNPELLDKLPEPWVSHGFYVECFSIIFNAP